ncbi:MAG: SH3 domain-containing protein [Clostridiaceae bacterium]|nr:SH3 domain-containing protein [Clostridiaceae bacterium]
MSVAISRMICVILSFFIVVCLFPTGPVRAEVLANATVSGSYVNVRASATTGSSIVAVLYCGHRVQITGPLVSDTWYPIKATDLDGVERVGFIWSEYLLLDSPDPIDPESSFELSISGFPESYKTSLRALHKKYPNWVFAPFMTNLDYETVISMEANESSTNPRSLIESYVNDAWQSTYTRNDATLPGWEPYVNPSNLGLKYDAYNWLTDTYISYDASRWVKTSRGYVAYSVDPRNFLSDTQIFQFFKLSYDPITQTLETVQSMLSSPDNSFMKSGIIKNDLNADITYAQAIMDAAENHQINPYFLTTRIKQEILKSNGQPADTASGTYPGFKGYYNFYNIGAVSNPDPIRPALIYASSTNENPVYNFNRPWTSQYKAIVGGAEWIASGYISRGQDTLYLQRFDLIDNADGLYSHQYMTSTQAPISEAIRLKEAYKDLTNLPLLFSIPVFNNMPETNVPPPALKGNPNNWVTELSITDQAITPSFDPNIFEYDLVVGYGIESVNFSVTKASVYSSLTGISWNAVNSELPLVRTGNVPLLVGTNQVVITCTAQNGDVRTYTINIVRLEQGVEPLFTSDYTLINQYLSGIAEKMTVETFLSGLTLAEGARAEVQDRLNQKVTDMTRIMRTGDRLVVYNAENEAVNLYYVILFGDVNGDGRINSYDMTITARHIIKENLISGIEFLAADVDKSGKLNSMDMTMIARHILKEQLLPQ